MLAKTVALRMKAHHVAVLLWMGFLKYSNMSVAMDRNMPIWNLKGII
jgi:hypothetical protein